jgi:hypothetical protein
MDVWMVVVFIYPFIIMTLHTIVQVIRKMKGKYGKLQQVLLDFGRVILPIMFVIFAVIYWIVGYIYAKQNAKRQQAPFQ